MTIYAACLPVRSRSIPAVPRGGRCCDANRQRPSVRCQLIVAVSAYLPYPRIHRHSMSSAMDTILVLPFCYWCINLLLLLQQCPQNNVCRNRLYAECGKCEQLQHTNIGQKRQCVFVSTSVEAPGILFVESHSHCWSCLGLGGSSRSSFLLSQWSATTDRSNVTYSDRLQPW